MRWRRVSFVAGSTAVALLAVAGFAAFGNPRPTSQEIQVEAAAASMGHTSGAYAGLAFAQLGGAGVEPPIDLDVPESYPDPDPLQLPLAQASFGPRGAGTQSSETGDSSISGWLSEVEVRALATLYFEPQDVNRAVRVAWCESRFDPDTVNLRTGAVGLYQHLPQYWDERASSAGFGGYPATNAEASTAAAAWTVYHGGGWDVFACRG